MRGDDSVVAGTFRQRLKLLQWPAGQTRWSSLWAAPVQKRNSVRLPPLEGRAGEGVVRFVNFIPAQPPRPLPPTPPLKGRGIAYGFLWLNRFLKVFSMVLEGTDGRVCRLLC